MQRANSLENTLMLRKEHQEKKQKEHQQKEKWVAENETIKQHHQLNRHEFEQTPGDGRGQRSLHATVQGVTKNQMWLSE